MRHPTQKIPTCWYVFASGNAKVLSFALGDAKVPNTNGFASQWNIGLTKNIEKTKAQIFPKNSNIDLQLLHQNNPITFNNTQLQYEPTFWYLGKNIDQNLRMESMYDTIYRNASHKLYIYRLVRGSLTMSAATQVLRAMFVSVLGYGNVFLTEKVFLTCKSCKMTQLDVV